MADVDCPAHGAASDLPDFVTVLPTGTTPTDEPLALAWEQQREVDAALDDIARCRAAAWVSAQSYMIHGGQT